MRHLFTSLYWLAFFLVLGLFALGAWAVSTPEGGQWLLNRINSLKPGMIEVSDFKGTFLNQPEAGEINVHLPNFDIEAKHLFFDYEADLLKKRQLRIRQLRFQELTIKLKKRSQSKETKDGFEFPVIQLPIKLAAENIRIDKLRIETAEAKTFEFDNVILQAEMQENHLALEKLALTHQKYRLSVTGHAVFSYPPNLQLAATISDPNDNHLDIHVDGRPQNYRLNANALMHAAGQLPEAKAELVGHGNLDELDIDQLRVETMKGEFLGNGKINWKNGLSGKVHFSAHDIDPGSIDPRYSGKISLGGQARLENGNVTTQLAALGEVGRFPFRIESDANIELETKSLEVRQGRLVMGSNVLQFSGRANPRQAEKLRFKLDMPRLSKIYPALKGSITGVGHFDGQWTAPEGTLRLQGRALKWATSFIDKISLDLRSESNPQKIVLALEASILKSGGVDLEQLRIKGSGDLSHQQAIIDLRLPDNAMRLHSSIAGNYDLKKHSWHGNIKETKLILAQLGTYRQQSISTIAVNPEGLQLAPFCLQNKSDRLCMDADLFRNQPSRAAIELREFPLQRFSHWLPPSKHLKETIDARVKLQGNRGAFSVELQAGLDQNNQASAVIQVEPDKDRIAGNMQGQFKHLDWLEPLSENLMNPDGKLAWNLNIEGSLKAPIITGNVALRDAVVRIPAAGIQLQQINVELSSEDGKTGILNGRLKSGKGNLVLKGKIDRDNVENWSAELNVTGKEAQVANLPLAQVWASPALRLMARPGRIDVTGSVTIPEAEIKLQRLPETAVTPSEDVYFLDSDNTANKKSAKFDVYSNIKLILGDKVHLSGYGLNTNLSGILRLSETPGSPVSADGSLKVVEGRYEALGQLLEIERGEIYFNGPVNTPRLNLRAVRHSDGIVTGLEISGTLQRPESRIFSDPPMDETNALAYLLTGKPLGATSKSDSNMLLTAVTRLGLKGSAKLVDDLRRRAGLDVLAIQPGEELEQTTLVLGKYLSPRFYIEYATGLIEDSSLLTIRYQINRHLQLEAQSSDQRQAIDLIYQIER